MSSNNISPITDESVDHFCSVTGASKNEGRYYMEASAGDMQAAIEMFFESSGATTSTGTTASTGNNSDVRAPIPQKNERLVGDDMLSGLTRRFRATTSVLNSFRNFHEEFSEEDSSDGSSTGSRRPSRLSRMFRPPIDLIFRGSFVAAKESAASKNRWLIVDLQKSDEFLCQALNRDVWNDTLVKKLVKKSFVLWQVDSNSIDGQRYMRFYDVVTWPHVAILDPRTGEKMTEFGGKDLQDGEKFRRFAELFLEDQETPEEEEDEEEEEEEEENEGVSGMGRCAKKKKKKKKSIFEASEEEQLRAAVLASLEVKKKTDGRIAIVLSDSEDEEGDCQIEAEEMEGTSENPLTLEEPETATIEDFFGPSTDSKTKLVIRLPSGERRVVEWPCTTKLRALLMYVREHASDVDDFQILTGFPRRTVDTSRADETTLMEAGLHPQETVFVHVP